MRSIYAAFIPTAQCQQTAEDWLNKGVALYSESKYDEAIKAYDEAIRLDPDFADAWYKKGVALKNQGEYDEAIKAYDEVIRLNHKDAYVWHNKGYALYAMGSTMKPLRLKTRQSS